jgi:hypothetical protein
MEPKFQTSFIPKGPISSDSNPVSGIRRTGDVTHITLLPTVSGIVFTIALLITGGLYGYEYVLNSQIADLDASLVHTKAAFDTDTVQQLIVESNQIRSAKTLLNKHVAISNIFALFQANVLPTVKFSGFTFDSSGSTILVTIEGEASSYDAIAQQNDLFQKITYMHDSTFTNLDLSDKGTVTLKFKTSIDPNLVSYKQALQNVSLHSSSPGIPILTTN